MSELLQALSEIQKNLNAPKNQYNSFGKYNYRSCEDILEGVKKVIGQCVLTVSDDVVMVGDRFYIKATATIKLGNESESVSAFARESLTKKGMDDSQITGSASSYARKYALNGLFAIDDSKDADTKSPAENCSVSNEPNLDLIQDAINRNDKDFIQREWQGLIANNWSKLNQSQTQKLNELVKG